MGYETRLLIGKACLSAKELEVDKTMPFKDGSGFPYKRDANGQFVPTGRTEQWFQVHAMVDLCKLGYQDDPLNRIQTASHVENGRENDVYYFYAENGNDKIIEDRYGARMYPVPIKDVLSACKASEDATRYRRLIWVIALLEAMQNDSEDLQCLFYGY